MFSIRRKVENQLDKKIEGIRSDRGSESEAPIGKFCAQHEIIHEVTTPYSPQSNGVAKNKNHTCDVNKLWIASEHVGWSHFSSIYLLNKISQR